MGESEKNHCSFLVANRKKDLLLGRWNFSFRQKGDFSSMGFVLCVFRKRPKEFKVWSERKVHICRNNFSSAAGVQVEIFS